MLTSAINLLQAVAMMSMPPRTLQQDSDIMHSSNHRKQENRPQKR